MQSRLILKKSHPLSENEALDVYLREVDKTADYPEGIKYSINYRVLEGEKWIVKIRIDNTKAQGHHIHIEGKIGSFDFISFDEAKNHVLKLRSDLKWKWK